MQRNISCPLLNETKMISTEEVETINDAATDCSLCVTTSKSRYYPILSYEKIYIFFFSSIVSFRVKRRLSMIDDRSHYYLLYTCRARIVQFVVKFCISVVPLL